MATSSSLSRTFRLLRLLPAEFQTPFGSTKPVASTLICQRNYSSAPQAQLQTPSVSSTSDDFPDGTFRASDLEVTLTPPFKLQPKPDVGNLIFGRTFSDHMFSVEWDKTNGWGLPHIRPMENLQIHPAAKVLHYAVEVTFSLCFLLPW